MNRLNCSIAFLLACTGATLFADIGEASACDPAEAVPIAELRPASEAAVTPGFQILAGIRGSGDVPLSLTRCASTFWPCDEVEQYPVEVVERIPLGDDLKYEWLSISKSPQDLTDGLYLTEAGEFEPHIETAGFSVDSGQDPVLASNAPDFRVQWDRVRFDDTDAGSCVVATSEGARIRVTPERVQPQIWYEIELLSPEAVRQNQDSLGALEAIKQRLALVPGWDPSDDDGVFVRSTLVSLYDVECVAVTARDLYGNRGATVEVCEPRLCATYPNPSVAEEVWVGADACASSSPDDQTEDEDLRGGGPDDSESRDPEPWKLDEPDDEPLTDAGCGCRSASSASAGSQLAIFLLLAALIAVGRRRRQRIGGF